ncbi:MAG: hypothetical protein C4562_03860 [Actinobacteria bacterium]|nr:MAG: hypothetical protein C4562_03860 [Actinomycetota bacterium]
MKKLLAVIVVISLLSFPLHLDAISTFEATQSGSARTDLNLEGGYVEDIAIAPNGTIYAASNSPNGIFASTNGGASWHGPSGNADMGSPIDVEVDGASNAYVIAGIDLYKTTNNGSSWSKLSSGKGNYDQTMLYAQNKLLVPSRDGSIDLSSNGGSSFSNVTIASGQRITSLASSPTAGTFYALVGSGTTTLYSSTDGGASWAPTGKAGDYSVVGVNQTSGRIVLAGNTNEYSDNGGGAWSSMGTGGSGHITFSSNRTYIGPSWTDNDGGTWHNLQNEAASYTSILKGDSFAVDGSNSNIMYIKSGRGIAKTTDGGANWTDICSGMTGITVNDISQARNKNVVWIAAYGGLARCSNFTSSSPTWTFPILPSVSVDSATSVWVNPSNTNTVLAGALQRIWLTTDGGSSWTGIDTGLTGDVKDFEAKSDLSVIYAAVGGQNGGGVLKSTDGGASWSSAGLSGPPVNTIAISGSYVYAGCGREFASTSSTRGIYRYNGSSWTHLADDTAGKLINDLLGVGSTIYAASGETGQGGVFKSTNNGSSWSELKKGLPTDGWFKALARESGSSTLYVSTSRPAGTSYIYKSMDDGASWGKYYTGLKDEGFNALLFDALVSGSNTGLFAYKSKAILSIAKKGKIKGKSRIKVVLKDKVTKKALRNRLIRLYKKVKVRKRIKKRKRWVWVWRLIARKRTNKKGLLYFYIRPSKKTSYRTKWIPKSRKDKSNYLSAISKAIAVK